MVVNLLDDLRIPSFVDLEGLMAVWTDYFVHGDTLVTLQLE